MEPPPQVTPFAAAPAAPFAASAASASAAAPTAASAAVPTAPSAAGAAPAADAAAHAFAAANHKRKLEDLYRSSKYFVIRTIVKDLRPSVVEILQAPDIRSSKAAQQMQIIMKFMMELLKEMKAESPFSGEHKKLKEEPLKKFKEEPPLTGASKDVPRGKPQGGESYAPAEPPLTGASKDVPRGKPQGGESYAPVEPQTGEIHVPPVNATVSAAQPEKPQSKPEKGSGSSRARNKSSGTENISVSKEIGKQLDGDLPLSYIVGGSPVGWNFLLYPGGEAVYYGVTKASARLRQAAK